MHQDNYKETESAKATPKQEKNKISSIEKSHTVVNPS